MHHYDRSPPVRAVPSPTFIHGLRLPATEYRMEDRQDPPADVIDEIASILAAGYLRMRNARTLRESGAGNPGEDLDSAPNPSLHRAGS